MPDFIEKWGRGPFIKTCGGLALTTVAVGVGFNSVLGAAVVGVPSALFAMVGFRDMSQTHHSILRNFPVLGHVRYVFESIRPEIRQYFVEGDQEAAPFSRENRTLVYQRAKGDVETVPFGTRKNVYETGYEWLNHSMFPVPKCEHARVLIGGTYSSALLNVSAMSFGAISANAVLALNTAAKMGGFSHNTGEGGASPFHLQPGGDVVWNVGTGYFGARNKVTGKFDPQEFAKTASNPSIKMIEIKLSQGAKPGEGGILPGAKVTPEIALTRGVELGQDCVSPSAHSAFGDAEGLILFAQELRKLSGGKPIGFKLCVGNAVEFAQVCKAMVDLEQYVDFITVDGKEGGTGAAPSEYSNHVGTPLIEGLYIVHNLLVGAGLRDRVKVIASGKIFSGFGMFRAVALGADVCNSARGMMFALGCIQSLKCHTNKCPVGVATQDKQLQLGLVVPDKAERVARFQQKTVASFLHLCASAGVDHPSKLNSSHLMIKTSKHGFAPYSELNPPLERGELLQAHPTRAHPLRVSWNEACQIADQKHHDQNKAKKHA